MLELSRHTMKIAHLNLRTELHGDEEVSAVDIKLSFDVPNHVLEQLSPGLRDSFFEAPDDPDLLGPDAQHLTHVKYPKLGTVKWDGEVSPVGVEIHTGNGKGKGDLIFPDATFGKLTVTFKEGGTCSCTARAQVQPSPDEVGKLSALLKHEVPVSLDSSQAVDVDEQEEEE